MSQLDVPAGPPVVAGTGARRANLVGAARAMAAEGVRLGLTVPTMVLVARTMAPADFGSFSGALALLSIVFPFACWAVGHVLIGSLARSEIGLERARAAAVAVLLRGTVAAGVLLMVAGPWLLPSLSRLDLALLAISELLATNAMAVVSQISSAERDFRTVLRLSVLQGVARLLGAAVFVWSGGHALSTWVHWYAAASLTAVAAMVLASRPWSSWLPRSLPNLLLLRSGAPFVLSAAAAEVIDDGDKVALVHYGHVGDAGVYAIAYRVAALVGMPARALLFVTYPQFFVLGHREPHRLRGYAVRQCGVALLPTLVVVGCAALLAPALVWALGDAYRPAVGYLRWLALIPVLRLVGYYGADVLTGLGRQWLRAAVQAAGALTTVVLLVALVPRHGGTGAIVVSLVVDAGVAVTAWGLAIALTTRRRLAPL